MIQWYFLFIPALTAILNRFARGEGKWARWQWYSFSTFLAYLVTLDYKFSAIWLFFLASYATPPNNALLSVVHGVRPGRKDKWMWQWMQTLSLSITNLRPIVPDEAILWRRFGLIYGTLQGVLMLPSIAALYWYMQAWPVLIGGLFLLKGWLFYSMVRIADRFDIRQDMAWPFSEVTIGHFLGVYLLICAGMLV